MVAKRNEERRGMKSEWRNEDGMNDQQFLRAMMNPPSDLIICATI